MFEDLGAHDQGELLIIDRQVCEVGDDIGRLRLRMRRSRPVLSYVIAVGEQRSVWGLACAGVEDASAARRRFRSVDKSTNYRSAVHRSGTDELLDRSRQLVVSATHAPRRTTSVR